MTAVGRRQQGIDHIHVGKPGKRGGRKGGKGDDGRWRQGNNQEKGNDDDGRWRQEWSNTMVQCDWFDDDKHWKSCIGTKPGGKGSGP